MYDRVILVYPASPGVKTRPSYPPLGLLTIAAATLTREIEVCILDERVEDDFDRRLKEELNKNPLCVGISTMSGNQIKGALRVSRLVKEHGAVPVVWGGVHPSLAPRSTVRHRLVDIIVRDDGEETFPRLLAQLQAKNADLSALAGIGFKQNNTVVLTEPAAPVDISRLPPLPFHLVDLNRYGARDHWAGGQKTLGLESSRGCPYRCTFCTESVRKKKWRALSPERAVGDIRAYAQRYGVTHFDLIDDNFFGTKERGEQIVGLLAEERPAIRWYTNIRPDFAAALNDGEVQALLASGIASITFGAESGSTRILQMVDKQSSVENIVAANRKFIGLPVRLHFVLILGFPGETAADIIKTLALSVKLLLENKNAICDMPFLIPTPGTIIAAQCAQPDPEAITLEEHAELFNYGIRFFPPRLKRPPWIPRHIFYGIFTLMPIARFIIINANRRHDERLFRLALKALNIFLRG